MKKSFGATQAGDEEGKAKLKVAFDALQPLVKARELAMAKAKREEAKESQAEREMARWAAEEEKVVEKSVLSKWDPRSFESPWVNALALPLVIGLAWGFNQTPVAFFIQGLKIWIHEFGHATVAWMSGFKALPLPIGWTNIDREKQDFVYWGVLFLLSVFFLAGWKERRFWPMFIAPPLALLQWHMTWRVEDWQTEQWIDFGGVGGEFYLSCLLYTSPSPRDRG